MNSVWDRGIVEREVRTRVDRTERQAAILLVVTSAGELALGDLEPRISLQRDLRVLLDAGVIREAGGAGPTDPARSYVPGKL